MDSFRILRLIESSMLLALLSDTHDNIASTRAAVDLLKPHNPAAWLHAGDLVSPSMLDLFAGLPNFHFVFGNNEYDHAAIKSRAAALNLHCHGDLALLDFSGKKIALLHGHDTPLLRRLADSGQHAYLIHGHTHIRSDHPAGTTRKTRLINPGALHRTRTKSAALLNLADDSLQFLELPATPA